MDEVAARWLREPSFFASLLSAFGLLAVVLAAGGIVAAIGFGVSRRVHEIGLRVALGASDREVVRLVTHETLALVVVGLGIATSVAGTRLLEGLLFRVEPRNPVMLGAVAVLFLAVAAGASWVPARRAVTLDPADALRHE